MLETFDQVEKGRLALLAAHDLAKHTQTLPAPVSSRSILKTVVSRGKGSSQQSSTKGCLSKLHPGDGEMLLQGYKAHAPLFMPLTYALEKSCENGWGSGWETAFTAQTRMSANAARQFEEIAEQFYRELLLSRLLDKA